MHAQAPGKEFQAWSEFENQFLRLSKKVGPFSLAQGFRVPRARFLFLIPTGHEREAGNQEESGPDDTNSTSAHE